MLDSIYPEIEINTERFEKDHADLLVSFGIEED